MCFGSTVCKGPLVGDFRISHLRRVNTCDGEGGLVVHGQQKLRNVERSARCPGTVDLALGPFRTSA